jgi:shikimate dehydrogenase
MEFIKADRPTFYFIGVTTTKSMIMNVFPLWAKELGLKDAVIKGIDIGIHEKPEVYREVVDFLKNDELSLGALVTTHKIDIYDAAKDMFDYLDPYATAFGELSSISKKNGKLEGYAKDPISSGLAMEAFVPKGFWKEHKGELFLLGAGGSAISIGAYWMRKEHGDNMPSKIIVNNRSQPRLDSIREIFEQLNPGIPVEYNLTPEPSQSDVTLAKLKPYSIVINATGLGKDRPGSPLTDHCKYPQNCLIWELNYRGERRFQHQAEEQMKEKGLYVEDGWIYFIHGWTQVIAEVFHLNISNDVFDKLVKIANSIK